MFYPCSSLSVRAHSALLAILCLGAFSTLPAFSQTATPPDVKPGRVEGTYFIGKTPGANVDMILWQQGEVKERKEIPRAKTDGSGNFVFENVAPGEYTVGHFQDNRLSDSTGSTMVWSSSHSRWVFVKSGETVKVQIGGTGRKIIGRMVAPEGVKIKLAWQGSSDRRFYTDQPRPTEAKGLSPEASKKFWEDYHKTDEYRKMRMDGITILPTVEEDGTFSAVDVPPGNYLLTIDVPEDGVHSPGRPAAAVYHQFTVPPGEDGSVVDLGAIAARMQHYSDAPKADATPNK